MVGLSMCQIDNRNPLFLVFSGHNPVKSIKTAYRQISIHGFDLVSSLMEIKGKEIWFFCFLIFSLRSFSCFSDTLQRSGGGRQPGENQSLLSPDLHYNRCNLPKHIEIFRKEVNIFGKCLLLFTRRLTSFGVNASFFPKKQRCNRLKSPDFL